ncbi:hypothetical protein PL84_03685 [Vibrio anguillarum]|uniref:hypothetical protein n=1 Tax=Vibrio anguillarum TaxID=55601 RepID=UPI00097E3817|nr:hypothetical protein [Vibrio anguillarum]MBT2909683.1 hypothetical protein [Vibrio anguillarum]MBT2942466.1 hypothetical protein [Vibrio anguillarum]MBT2950710.1 hypothetical protein [Vibrio anguillarum]MBT2979625.1 hypothetical protein [Vibrio anguillarum]
MKTFFLSLFSKLACFWYFVRYSDKLPYWQAANARFFLITMRRDKANDVGLLEHEKFHVKQWWFGFLLLSAIGWPLMYCSSSDLVLMIIGAVVSGCSPACHALLYYFVRPYRQWSEVKAYRIQLARGGYGDKRFAVLALMHPKYRLNLTEIKAKRLLGLA